MKKPKVGNKIEHTCTLNGVKEGIVKQLLSQQFIYETDKGHTHFCMYREQWKVCK